MDSLKEMREATSAAYRCWKKDRGSRSTCQKKPEESASVSFRCQRVSVATFSHVMTVSSKNATAMAKQKFVIQSRCLPVMMSSKKIWLKTGEAKPGTMSPKPIKTMNRAAHLSSSSFSATAL